LDQSLIVITWLVAPLGGIGTDQIEESRQLKPTILFSLADLVTNEELEDRREITRSMACRMPITGLGRE
jgi:hypothetical protein